VENHELFENSEASIEVKLNNFPKYVSQRKIARFLTHYELFKMQLHVKGSIVDCGVFHGGSLLTWARLSAIFEPFNYHRKIIGFDSFEGFPSVDNVDSGNKNAKVGGLSPNYKILNELEGVIKHFDLNRPMGEIEKIDLVKGDALQTIPKFISDNKWLVCSLLYLDFDLFKPTRCAIENIVPRMPKGSIIVFDELANWDWPGETLALVQTLGINKLEIKHFPWEPNVSYAIL
jgi:hypothetical protein